MAPLRERLKMAWAIIRGRPVMYRMNVRADHMVEPMGKDSYITDCEFDRHGIHFPYREGDG